MSRRPRTKQAAERRLARLGIPPRGLDADLAAAYVGLGRDTFLKAVGRGELPSACEFGDRRIWDRAALDRALAARLPRGRVDDASPPVEAAGRHDPIMDAINGHAAEVH